MTLTIKQQTNCMLQWTLVTANQTSGQKNEPRSTSAQIAYSVHHNELQWVTVNYCAAKYCQLLWNTVDEKLSLNLSHVFNDLMICSVAGFRQSSTPRHDAVKLFFWRCFAPWRENKHQIGEITKHIQSVSLGCFDHAHEESARICTLIRRRKEKILTVDHKRLNGVFCKIICRFHFGMI